MFRLVRVGLLLALVTGSAFGQSTQTPAYTPDEADSIAQMQALEASAGPDKRAFIQEQMNLTPEEDAKFWPIYDAHQAALREFNQRRLDNIMAYARRYNDNSLDDASATKIAEDALALEKDEAVNMERTFHKLIKVIPAVKAARYLQVENKLRAMVRLEQAAQVPYAK